MTDLHEKPVDQSQSRLIRRLIDPTEALRLLRQVVSWPAGTSPASLSVARVFPSKGGGVGVQWDICVEGTRRGTTTSGSIYAGSRSSSPKKSKNNIRLAKSGPFPFLDLDCCVEGADLVLNTPDQDASLSGIVEAAAGPRMKERLTSGIVARILGRTNAWECDCLNYRPRRRCVLRYRRKNAPNGPFVVGKIYRNGQAIRTPQIIRQARSDLARRGAAELSIPRVLTVWHDWNMVLFEGVLAPESREGRSAGPIQLAQAAGNVLATLHDLSPGKLSTFTPSDELMATARWVELGALAGRIDARAKRIWIDLRKWRHRLPRSSGSLIHRDFYDSQLLPTRQGWAIVDFDTAARGDAEQDVGNFIGHLIWDSVRDGRPRAMWVEAAACFLESYEKCRTARKRTRRSAVMDAARMRFYLVSSLLRVGIIHGLRTGTRRQAQRLHDIADAFRRTSPKRLLAHLRDAGIPSESRCSS
ncbi:MAG: aminoglycoside phosphotransferase family protein [Planctomycetia bacterium]|nr:aminoglycoside phosphotransferase family protein [Planctomycetia bacterium]MCC7316235.1 aminoglycoside phosphotransferase family protein [Planctomycetota bacterium]OQY98473.1 MAG: hypothetical protein B6D36_17530 [Planctomycetes bacterium UTPLA1]